MSAMTPFYGRTYPTQTASLVWEATQLLKNSLADQSCEMRRSQELIMSLSEVLENSRELYNNIIAERDSAYRRLQEADTKLQQVENVVRRYAEVKDPVVASDGYTYERAELSRYLTDCKKSSSKAYSQQTKEELTDVMVENVSLRRLAELLKGVHSVEVPQLTTRPPLVSGGVDMNGSRSRWAEEAQSMGGLHNTEMGPASVSLSVGAGGRGMNGMGMGSGHTGSRFDRGGGAKSGKPNLSSDEKGRLHPCLRVYGFCNFEDDCTFANYPFEACLNHIKGKCRFGPTCKELHVDPRDPAYQNARSFSNHQHSQGTNGANMNPVQSSTAGATNDESSSQTADAGVGKSMQTECKVPEPLSETEAATTTSETAASTKRDDNAVENAGLLSPATGDAA
ncbi:hypothetical protein JKF63_05750 [Porcisia hertigi]|uniref:C3H1-type domain-containing protein n=1 Tax=Porcisia hertigi TaxID=2761500 RepID=A0A836LCI4_9TRYP|nr:hypothetical protein JKF63_05750 [Porcisia hertigi]